MPKLTDVESLVGLPYCEETFDCADFVAHAQAILFDRNIAMPGRRPRGEQGQAELSGLSKQYANRTDSPIDGDLVLMIEHGGKVASHVGIYFVFDHQPWVLHSTERCMGSSLHRIKDLPGFGLRVEGYYSWI